MPLCFDKNALFNHGIKQKNQLQLDLEKFGKDVHGSPISLQGSISATLVSFQKTIEQYGDHLKKYEQSLMNGDADEDEDAQTKKYENRLSSLKEAHGEFSARFAELKKEFNSSNARTQLFGNTNGYAMDGIESVVNKRNVGQSRDGTSPRSSMEYRGSGLPLYQGLQKEQSIFQRGNTQLELILEMGHQSLDDLVEQNQILLKLQDRMSSTLRTLGLSESTIQKINKRAFKDKLIFYFVLALLLVGFYFVIKWFK